MRCKTALGAAVITVGVFGISTPAENAAAQTSIPCDSAALERSIAAANNTGGSLQLASECTYSLSAELPHIHNAITITGGDHTTIRRAPQVNPFRVFTVEETGNLTLSHVVIKNGDASNGGGGGIWNKGTLDITQSIITDNRAGRYGGVFNDTEARTNLQETEIIGNEAAGDGGGAGNLGTMTMHQSIVSGNSAHGQGGGLFNVAKLNIKGSNVSKNNSSRGGGIANVHLSGSATVTVSESMISNNDAKNAPGGIYNNEGSVTLTSSNVNSNSPSNCSGSFPKISGCSG